MTRDSPAPRIYTTRTAADALGVSRQRVQQLAEALNLGEMLHRRQRIFTPVDIDTMRARVTTPGRKRQTTPPEP